jgi:hypothetical protein
MAHGGNHGHPIDFLPNLPTRIFSSEACNSNQPMMPMANRGS